MKIYDYHEIDELPQGEWIECCDGLPPPGKEVIVETTKGKVTALACFIDYEGAPPERGRWDNQYPGKGNCHLMDSIVRWQPMPRPKTPNVEFSGGAPLHGAASAGTKGYTSGDENGN